jgi:hypothetical protein
VVLTMETDDGVRIQLEPSDYILRVWFSIISFKNVAPFCIIYICRWIRSDAEWPSPESSEEVSERGF